MKSSYMISAIGRMPWSAAPIAAPASAISEIGVLRTRCGPNSSSIPAVTPIEPPISAMSSPMMKTSSSWRFADLRHLGVHLLELGVRHRDFHAQELDRVALLAQLLRLVLRPVDLGVAN